MQPKDWLDRWQMSQIGFHQSEVNCYLRRYLNQFNLNPGDRIFLPLCGKSHDIAWLAEQGYEVIGIELASIAIEAFFNEFELQYQQFESDRFILRKSGNIMLLEGDYFDLQAEDIEGCRLVFDRAALIAIDEANRARYCRHLRDITAPGTDMLLVTLDYDQSVMSGPPFAVSQQEVLQHYQPDYQIDFLEQQDVVDEQPHWREKGLSVLLETACRLSRR